LDVWIEHWGCASDPFEGPNSAYVPLRSHEQAVARLAREVAMPARRCLLWAEAGLGKSRVLERLISAARDPRRKFVAITCLADSQPLVVRLAELLGSRGTTDRFKAWISVERALRAAALARAHFVFVIDDFHRLEAAADRADLENLSTLNSAVTIIEAGHGRVPDGKQSLIGLDAVGCRDTIFTPRAVTRLHGLSEGVPRALERLATHSLMAGADRGIEVVTADVVDGAHTRLEFAW
jgi:type II secretory pathway predicted ATPase ExeA